MPHPTFSAVARDNLLVDVYIDKEFSTARLHHFKLYADGVYQYELRLMGQSESHSSSIYSVSLKKGSVFIPGVRYEIVNDFNFFIPIDISFLSLTEEFEAKYRYEGKLGAIYEKNQTTFRVFTPFAEECRLLLFKKGKADIYDMTRLEGGVYETLVHGNLSGVKYLYQVKMFGELKEVVDPYAFSVDSNSRHGYVINPNVVTNISNGSTFLPKFDDWNKAIIYECHVRDMTSLAGVNHAGTYKALSESDLVSKEGTPAGIDYIASLGVTHVQFQPLLDYQTVNDDDPKQSYNWGYDPLFYFAPEGSMSTNPESPYSRLLELRSMVSSFHKKGIRVIVDVVYNHVFSYRHNSLAVLVPKYYFRYNSDGSMSNGSGCGNDVASERYMVRKLIVDSMCHLIRFYDIDGLRLDLMGLIDSDTSLLGYSEIRKIKPDCMFYGEGWDMWTNLPFDKKTTLNNAMILPYFGFFNDRFRDVVKGKSGQHEIYIKGYLLGDVNYREGFKHVLLGSVKPMAFAPLFKYTAQSINYVECHDNATLRDKIAISCADESEAEHLDRIKLCNFTTLLALGVPFVHAGQEIGFSKNGNHNSYNSGDNVNGFDYSLLKRNAAMADYFRDAVKLRKFALDAAGESFATLADKITFEDLPSGCLKVNIPFTDFDAYIIFNPTKNALMYDFKEDVSLIFNNQGYIGKNQIKVALALVNGLSANVYLKDKTVYKVADLAEIRK